MKDQAFKETSKWILSLCRQFYGFWVFKVFLIPSWSTYSAPTSSWKYLLVEAALLSVFLLHLWFDPISFWSLQKPLSTYGHELGQTLGNSERQGSLVCCSSWGCKESDITERLNWTELSIKRKHTTDTCKVNEPQKQPIELNKPNKTHTVWFYLYEILEKAEL